MSETLKFRTLKADEIDVRIAQIGKKSVMLLLYKDARCDQNILDEAVGTMNWQRHHSRDNANCVVSIWDESKKQWIEKEDTGTESFTEREKGLASDSFKRACVNWGIGRELYTAPNLFFDRNMCNISSGNNGVEKCYDKFTVIDIAYTDVRTIESVDIKNESTGAIISYGTKKTAKKQPKSAGKADKKADEVKAYLEKIMDLCKRDGLDPAFLAERCKKESFNDISEAQANWLSVGKNWDSIKKEYLDGRTN